MIEINVKNIERRHNCRNCDTCGDRQGRCGYNMIQAYHAYGTCLGWFPDKYKEESKGVHTPLLSASNLQR